MNKFIKVKKSLSTYYDKEIVINLSPATGYRSRCEFGYKNNCYTMIDNGKKVFLKTFNLPHQSIQNVMEPLLKKIQSNLLIEKKLFQINFRTAHDVVLVTLIYHKELDNNWLENAKVIAANLNIHIVGRSRKKLLATGVSELEELINTHNPFCLGIS